LTQGANKSILTKQKLYSIIFQNSQVVADPFIALALFSPPLASSIKTGSTLALLTPLPHQKSSTKSKRQ
jgi:hypothetical protein